MNISFDSIVIERIQEEPEFRKELLNELVECIVNEDFYVARRILDNIIKSEENGI